jgi:hypothetical protein
MKNNIFNDLTKKYFEFLISDYDFRIVEDSFEGNAFFGGRVVFSSQPRKGDIKHKQTGVQVTLDRGYIGVRIGPFDRDKAKEGWLALSEIMRLIKPEIIVYDETKPDFSKGPEIIFEPTLIKLSNIVRTHCDPFLKGDFSMYDRIVDARIKWREQYIKNMQEKYPKK